MNYELRKKVIARIAGDEAISSKEMITPTSNFAKASSEKKAMADRSDATAMAKIQKSLIIFFTFLFIAVGCNQKIYSPTAVNTQGNYNHSLQVGPANLMVEIADTQATMSQGLSDRLSMQQNQGMLFDFDKLNSSTNGVYPSFWMKDMNFNLDFIWIYKNQIIGITPDVPAPIENLKLKTENLPNYYPPSPIDWVLEVNADWTKKNNINVGDVAKLNDKN